MLQDEANLVFYRFRKSPRAISEIEKQTIYLSSLEEMNDPMEGFSNIYWQGDKVLWENLIKDYLFRVLFFFVQKIFGCNENNVLSTLITPDYVDTPIKKLSDDFINYVFNKEEIQSTIILLEKKVIKEQLVYLLKSLYPFIIIKLHEFLSQKNLTPSLDTEKINELNKIIYFFNTFNDDIAKIINDNDQQDRYKFFIDLDKKLQEWSFLRSYQDNIYSEITDIPKLYVNQLIEELYPKFYTACFSSLNDNLSMWGYYADDHKGIALQFTFDKKINENNQISLVMSFADTNLELKKVNYKSEFPELNFFENFGRIPMSKMNKFWLESNGVKSCFANNLSCENIDNWRYKLWKNFLTINTFKHQDWQHESEYRLVLYCNTDGLKPGARKFDFKHLTGVVFGIKTPDKDKIKIINEIKKKCTQYQRDNFKFYQAYFSPYDTKMKILELDSKFNLQNKNCQNV
jgi:hypothetical protein